MTDQEVIQRYFARFDESFFQFCDMELLKINTFFSGKSQKNRVRTARGGDPCQGKHKRIWKFCQKIENFVCSSCKFTDSKGKGFAIFVCTKKNWRLDMTTKFAEARGEMGKQREFENAV